MTHRFELSVYYEDTDLSGIVYHANFLKFMERARTEALAESGIDQRAMLEAAGIAFAVRRLAIDYVAPARFRDRLAVTTETLAIGGARVDLLQEVRREPHLLARAEVRIVCMKRNGGAARLPKQVRAALARLGSAADAP